MTNYYFTYGSEGQPFCGGWTEITAPDMRTACEFFRFIHPDKIEGYLNCCSVYSEENFKKSEMYTKGNFGIFCREKYIIQIQKII